MPRIRPAVGTQPFDSCRNVVRFFDVARLFVSMSGFDEEAERERLREKYEENQEEREATQRMSELLLKGATMTNSHCDTCGDPLFRHDGQTFCPTCQAAGGEQAATDAEAASAEDSSDAEPSPAATEPARDAPATPNTARESPSPTGGDASTDAAPVADRPAPRTETGGDPRATARASLSRTLVKYAQAAEETDDPRRAKELLAAAREAAETLAALD